MFGGDDGFVRVVSAAVAADSLVLAWGFIKLEDAASADYSLSGVAAAKLLYQMKCLLKQGGLFVQEAEGTLTHAALKAMKGKMVFWGDRCVNMQWPELEGKRREPIRAARRHV